MDIKLTHIPTGHVWHRSQPHELVDLLDQLDPWREERENYEAHVTY